MGRGSETLLPSELIFVLAQRRKGAEKEGTEAGGRKEKTEVRCPREVTCA
jgi:hypothetical protein